MTAPGNPAYSALVERLFAEVPCAGELSGTFETELHGAAGQRAQGTRVVFHAGLNGERIESLRFQAYGCPHTIAACGLVAEELTGGPVGELGRFDTGGLAARLEMPVEKAGRLLIVQDALRNCMQDWENKRFARE